MAKRSSWLILRDSIIPTGPIRTSFERSQTGSLKPISSGSGLLALSTCTELSTFALGIKNLRMSCKLCGEQGLGSVVLATTMWSLCLAADASRREDQLSTRTTSGYSSSAAARVFWQGDGAVSGQKIIDHLINRAQPVTLDIQRKMVD